jgi:hypothetical protein
VGEDGNSLVTIDLWSGRKPAAEAPGTVGTLAEQVCHRHSRGPIG